ncbi:hypothetical protein [Archangium sp.]|uniref:hypothetical protein n=1 Tax=Archangium sp. TaxID=1872627 RepID=UPI002D64B8DB|nr:hypothetical protein [Archangium sp.]HYO52731.1 hypothetical protein [Archangium sp.]
MLTQFVRAAFCLAGLMGLVPGIAQAQLKSIPSPVTGPDPEGMHVFWQGTDNRLYDSHWPPAGTGWEPPY